MTDIIRPARTTVRLARKRRRLCACIDSPGTTETGGSERAEVATVGTLGFDDHEVLV